MVNNAARRRRPPGGRRFFPRRKVCAFCVDKVKSIDYKEVGRLRRYVSEWGKIESRRKTGTCSPHQRMLSQALKRARFLALLPYTGAHSQIELGRPDFRNDRFRRDRPQGDSGPYRGPQHSNEPYRGPGKQAEQAAAAAAASAAPSGQSAPAEAPAGIAAEETATAEATAAVAVADEPAADEPKNDAEATEQEQ